jgi:pimeloyl-ACP methyl ester carboxylesterase
LLLQFSPFPWRAEPRNGRSSGRFLTVNGVRLHYTDSGGSGVPVVLIHGNTVTFEDWRLSGVSAKAEQRYRVIAFDRPGFGYSERPRLKLWTPGAHADLIHQALASLGVTQAIVVGHSFGALVAVALAVRHPRLVQGLVAAPGYYFPTFRLDAKSPGSDRSAEAFVTHYP